MPSPFLTLKERVRLTCFPDAIPQWDLITYFTLTEHDGSLIDTYQGDTNRLGAALQLCAVRYLGFCPADLHTASSDVTTFLASQLRVDPSALHDYGTRRMTAVPTSMLCCIISGFAGFSPMSMRQSSPG